MPRIRGLVPDDVPAAANLLAQLASEFITPEFAPDVALRFLSEHDAASFHQRLHAGFQFWVAEQSGELLGFIGIRPARHIFHLFVAKKMHRRGVARALWDVARNACEQQLGEGAFTVNSSTYAVVAYEHLGFRRVEPVRVVDGVIHHPMIFDSVGVPNPTGHLTRS